MLTNVSREDHHYDNDDKGNLLSVCVVLYPLVACKDVYV